MIGEIKRVRTLRSKPLTKLEKELEELRKILDSIVYPLRHASKAYEIGREITTVKQALLNTGLYVKAH